jgi:hypothetical protein
MTTRVYGDGPVIEQACCEYSLLAAFGENSRKASLRTSSKALISHKHHAPWRALKNRPALPWAGQWLVTRHRRQFLPGALRGDGTSVRCPDQSVGGADPPQAGRQNVELPLVRYFVSASRPSDERALAHHDVPRERSLPRLAVGRTGDPDELQGRHYLAAGSAPEFRILTDGGAPGCEPRLRGPALSVPTNPGHELPFGVAEYRLRSLPWPQSRS